MTDELYYHYLEWTGDQPDVNWAGLEVSEDGALRLASLPLFSGNLPPALGALPDPGGPVGIALAPDGTLYYADTVGHRIWRRYACGQDTPEPAPCLGGRGSLPGEFSEPRGLLWHMVRNQLFVADSLNHRIQIFEPPDLQLVGVWGQPDPATLPTPGDSPGRMHTPWALAADSEGNVYVAEHGNGRVQKLDVRGDPVPLFWETVQRTAQQHAAALIQPVDIAVYGQGVAARVYVLDAGRSAVRVFDLDGHYQGGFEHDRLAAAQGILVHSSAETLPCRLGSRATADTPQHAILSLYIGDNARRQLLRFTSEGTLVGEAHGYEGPVGALTLDTRGDLLVNPGGGLAPLALSLAGAYARRGWLWAGPFHNPSPRSLLWLRVKGTVEGLGEGTHVQLFVYESCDLAPVPVGRLPDPFADPRWRETPVGPDAAECLVPGEAEDYISIGLDMAGEGLSSPALSRLRIDFDHETWLRYLPGIYQHDPASRSFMARFLSLFESAYDDVEADIAGLPALFDPHATPAAWLENLAGWLALPLDGAWSVRERREAIAGAFETYAWRGTARGLRLALRRQLGVEAVIEEPLAQAAWWALAPEGDSASPAEAATAVLGVTTMLAAAEPQGAVVGSTAVLDYSHLIYGDEMGEPLFSNMAYQFSVQLYRGASYRADTLKQVEALLDREMPAHTAYHVCIIEPAMRVGLQGRVGIDTIVAGPPSPTTLGEPGVGLWLGGDLPALVGQGDQVGRTIRLGESPGPA